MTRLGRRALGVLALAVALTLGAAGAVRAAEDEHAAAVAEGEAHGEGEGHGAVIDGKNLALQLLNFGVLLGILIVFGGKAINKALGARHEQLKSELAAASTARAAAEESLRKQEQRLKGLENEIADMRAGIKKEAEVEKGRLVAAAEERAKRLLEETTFVIEQQTKEAQATLRREAAQAGVTIAEQLLRQSFQPSDQQRMLNGFVDDVAGAPARAAGDAGKVV